MVANKKIIFIFLFCLLAAISLSPRFSFGHISGTQRSIDLRIEDFVLLLGLAGWIFYALAHKKHSFKLPPLFWPILIWIAWGFFSVVVNLLLLNIQLSKAFFYFGKEVEFFLLYFIAYNCIKDQSTNIFLKKLWMFFGFLNIAWITYVLIAKPAGFYYYGADAFMEPQGPFPSGGFFLILFILLFNLFIFYGYGLKISPAKKLLFLILSIIPAIGVIASGSRASTIGMTISVLISLFILFSKGINFARAVKIGFFAGAIFCLFIALLYSLPVAKRAIDLQKMTSEYTSSAEDSRISIFKSDLNTLTDSPEKMIIGVGVFGEAHSQYMRILLERGFFGLIIFGWLMASLLKICWKNFNKQGLPLAFSVGLFSATLVMLLMSVPNDPFMVVKIGEIYWFFAAMAMASFELKNN